jgi:hypothetical protein
MSASPGGNGLRGTLIRVRSPTTGMGGNAIGRVRLETAALRERRGCAWVDDFRARSPLAVREVEWDSVPGRLVLKFVFISLETLESLEANLFTGFTGLIPRDTGFTDLPP